MGLRISWATPADSRPMEASLSVRCKKFLGLLQFLFGILQAGHVDDGAPQAHGPTVLHNGVGENDNGKPFAAFADGRVFRAPRHLSREDAKHVLNDAVPVFGNNHLQGVKAMLKVIRNVAEGLVNGCVAGEDLSFPVDLEEGQGKKVHPVGGILPRFPAGRPRPVYVP